MTAHPIRQPPLWLPVTFAAAVLLPLVGNPMNEAHRARDVVEIRVTAGDQPPASREIPREVNDRERRPESCRRADPTA